VVIGPAVIHGPNNQSVYLSEGSVLFGRRSDSQFIVLPNCYNPQDPENAWRPMRAEQLALTWEVWFGRGLWPPHAPAGEPLDKLLQNLWAD
jgi:hypothetical protein